MSTSYLRATVSAPVDANGRATAKLFPQVGQYWAPSIVSVSTGINPTVSTSGSSAQALCKIYQGVDTPLFALNVFNNAYAFLDSTSNGSGDTSSIMAGTVVMFGEAIIANWTAGVPGDTALLTVFGRSATTLEELQEILSPIPGARFSGNHGNSMPFAYGVSSSTNGNWTATPIFTTPTNQQVELVSVEFTATTNATVGNRWFGIDVIGGTTPFFRLFSSTPQPASCTARYNFSRGSKVAYSAGDVANGFDIGAGWGDQVILAFGTVMTLREIGGVPASDTWANYTVRTRLYSTQAKVGYA